jgi:uncharacterized membrane protein YidH (DUF202 family)
MCCQKITKSFNLRLMKKTTRSANRADHMANERTFLAWIRTSIGVMAFGFVVENFSLFINQLAYFVGKQGAENISLHPGYSSIFGILLIIFGVLIGLFSFVQYKKVGKQIDEDRYKTSTTLATTLVVTIVGIGCFLVIYLIA